VRRQGKCSLTILILYAFSLQLQYCMRPLNWIPTYTFRIGICVWVVLLSPTVMRVVQVFHLYDVGFGLWIVESLVFYPLRCELIMVRIDAVIWAWVGMVETVGIHQVMWLVVHESAKDWILEEDTPGQQVSPHVRYGMAWLLIRTAICCESCSVVWGKMQNVIWSTRCKWGLSHEETLAL
jgi:hypothetical protein